MFEHDFDHLCYDEPEYDADLGMPGLHSVRARVEASERAPCIPPDLFARYAETKFWDRPQMNTRGAVVL